MIYLNALRQPPSDTNSDCINLPIDSMLIRSFHLFHSDQLPPLRGRVGDGKLRQLRRGLRCCLTLPLLPSLSLLFFCCWLSTFVQRYLLLLKTFKKNKTNLNSVSSLTSYSLSPSLRYLRCYDRSISPLPLTFVIRLWAQIRNRKLGEAR